MTGLARLLERSGPARIEPALRTLAQPPLNDSRPAGHVDARSRMVVALRERETFDTFLRLATATAVGLAALLPMVELGRIAASHDPLTVGPILPALVATGSFLPLHLWHVLYALRGCRPRRAGWTLAVMAIVIVAATPVVGAGWLLMFASLVLSVLIVVRPPWSFLLCLAVVLAMAPLALAFDGPGWTAVYYPIEVAWRGTTLFVLVWLVAAARQLQTARVALSDTAVLSERLRIEDELRATVGDALARIVEQGKRARRAVGSDPAHAETELHSLVKGSRQALAEARRIARSYSRASLRAELDTAATLLTAAGVEANLVLPPDDLPEVADEATRSTLRLATARLLADNRVRRCTIAVTRVDGQLRLEVESGGRERETIEVTA